MYACSPHFISPGDNIAKPKLTANVFISFDGTELPLRTWLPSAPPMAVFIALHGYNDYSNFIKDAITSFNERGLGVYSYDQRGFGGAPDRGRWSGIEAMVKDLRTIIALVHERHPDVPLYLLGDSMGGAVIMTADSTDNPLECDGVVLVAPAVWSRHTMPYYQRWALWLGARIIPWVRLSAKGLDIAPSDNDEMLKELSRDPLVIKESRIDSVYGMANLMDAAYEAADGFNRKVLFLYGARDEIIPPKPMADIFGKRVHGKFTNLQRLLVYENGYHMLLRDLQAEVVLHDIFFWLASPSNVFPSVQERTAQEITSDEDIQNFLLPVTRN